MIRCFLLVPSGRKRPIEGLPPGVTGEEETYVRADGQPGEYTLRGGQPDSAPPGAMWYAPWFDDGVGGLFLAGRPADGWLVVRLPNGHDWLPDMRATNCAMPDDDQHRCWVRHGTPPAVTVDKAGGRTCAAGAGSIGVPGYHGFLRGGCLT